MVFCEMCSQRGTVLAQLQEEEWCSAVQRVGGVFGTLAVHSLINLCLLGSLPRPGDGHMPTQKCCS